MKFIITSLIVLLACLAGNASDSILLRPISYSKVFGLAKKENKHVMLYFHFDGCGACVQMEKTAFADNEVAGYYNANFVSLDINTRKGEGIETNTIYNVRSHPTFLYLDTEGNILHKIVGVFSPEEFIEHAKDALSGKSNYAQLKKEYASGNRNADFLYDYALLLRDAIELDAKVINEYLNTQSIADLSLEKNIRFIYEFVYHNHEPSIDYSSPSFQLLMDHPDTFKKYFDAEQVKSRIAFVLSSHLYDCIEHKDELCFNMALEEVRPYQREQYYEYKEMDGRLTAVLFGNRIVPQAKMDYYKKVGKLREYDETLMGYIKSIWDSADQLNSLAWEYYETQTNEADLEKALAWVKRSMELEQNYFNTDTYAALLYKTGNYKEAIKQAKKAIALAKETEKDYSETTLLIKEIKKARS